MEWSETIVGPRRLMKEPCLLRQLANPVVAAKYQPLHLRFPSLRNALFINLLGMIDESGGGIRHPPQGVGKG
jgi:hypothetical protein